MPKQWKGTSMRVMAGKKTRERMKATGRRMTDLSLGRVTVWPPGRRSEQRQGGG